MVQLVMWTERWGGLGGVAPSKEGYKFTFDFAQPNAYAGYKASFERFHRPNESMTYSCKALGLFFGFLKLRLKARPVCIQWAWAGI